MCLLRDLKNFDGATDLRTDVEAQFVLEKKPLLVVREDALESPGVCFCAQLCPTKKKQSRMKMCHI